MHIYKSRNMAYKEAVELYLLRKPWQQLAERTYLTKMENKYFTEEILSKI